MALSYLTESEAPRDFRVSSIESEGHCKKCLLCYTVKKNFYCTECIRTGNFVHSSMPYSDRYAEKQAKLLRLKVNRKHILDRCEKFLSPKLKKDKLLTESKQSRDKLDLLHLAIEQRRNNVQEKQKQLNEITNYNNELRLKLPRYQKRVASLGKHAQMQRIDLQNKASLYNEQAEALAALRRLRIRQLINYIFPVYVSYDNSDSIEDMEFIGGGEEEEPPKRSQLHIVAPWIDVEADFAHGNNWTEAEGGAGRRAAAALALGAQLAALLAWLLDARLPHAIALSEYSLWRVSESGAAWRAGRLGAALGGLCARQGLPPPALPAPPAQAPREGGRPHALTALHTLAIAASTDDPLLGRVGARVCSAVAAAGEAWERCAGPAAGDGRDEPEHLAWPEPVPPLAWPDPAEMEELGRSPAAGAVAPSLMTSAAASLASMLRGWTK